MLGIRNTWASEQVMGLLDGRPRMAVDELDVFTCGEPVKSVEGLTEWAWVIYCIKP